MEKRNGGCDKMNALEKMFKEKANDKYLEFAQFSAKDVRKALLDFAEDIEKEAKTIRYGLTDYADGRKKHGLEIALEIRMAVGK